MKRNRVRCLIAVLLISAAFALSASAIPATVLTNTGAPGSGNLTGLGSILRLVRPTEPALVGPDAQFDVPLSAIRQITFDFPRVILETATRTLIGPFSAFRGIAEILSFTPDGEDDPIDLPTAAFRAIALNGHNLRPVPREWLGTEFLTEPDVVTAAVPGATIGATSVVGCVGCEIDTSAYTAPDGDETPIWNTLTPTVPPEEETSGIPWWVGLLGVALVVGVFYLVSGTGS